MANSVAEAPTAFFRENGYILLANFVSEVDCASLIDAIESYRRTKDIITVERSSFIETKRFMTLNGTDVEAHVPYANHLYGLVNDTINSLTSKQYVQLENRSIGLSINIVPAGGVFSWHYDRNEITAVLYLNEVEGGEMELYPRYRLLTKGRHGGVGKWIQRVPDALIRPAAVRELSGRTKVVVPPRPGTLLIMEASRCLHRVGPVISGARYSVQFAYDQENVSFDERATKDYYGYR